MRCRRTYVLNKKIKRKDFFAENYLPIRSNGNIHMLINIFENSQDIGGVWTSSNIKKVLNWKY